MLKDPKQWGTNKADVMAAKPKENKPGEGDNKKYEPVSSGDILPLKPGDKELSPKITEASVKVVLGMHATEVPEMVVSGVRAEIIDAEDSGPMQATFESKPKLKTQPIELNKKMILEVVIFLTCARVVGCCAGFAYFLRGLSRPVKLQPVFS